ncbi:S-layer homology domain-containing protein [Candidatus Margulisiibacteriota bacterium]
MIKKIILALIVLLLMVGVSAAAEIKLKDVPDDHWAATAIYDLVRMGVTKGYPDGTFRGTKKITRFETAIFLYKLAQAIGAEDLKADVKKLKEDIAALKGPGGGMLAGSYQANWKFGNLFAESGGTRGSVVNYRLKLSTSKQLDENTDVTVNLDTMDYGFFDDNVTTTGDVLATELLDIESNLRLNVIGLEKPVALKVTYGPGAQQHTVDSAGTVPSDVGIVYSRPDTGIKASTSLWGADVSGGYYAISLNNAGRVLTSKITGNVGYVFIGIPLVSKLNVEASGDYISAGQYSSSTRDMRATVAMAAPLHDRVSASTTLGIGGSAAKNLLIAGDVTLKDFWDTGTVAIIRVAKVGSEFIDPNFSDEEFDFAGLDTFDRPLENATVNIGGKVSQAVSNDIRLIGKGDLRLTSDYKYQAPYGRLTAEGGISYTVAPNTSLDAMYRLHQDKSSGDTSDIAALGLLYNF